MTNKKVFGPNSLFLDHTGWLEFPPNDLVAQYIREGWFEYTERAFMFAYLKPGEDYLDIGAHAGFHASTARRLIGSKGRVVCIEPNTELHAYLEANVPDCEIHAYAISNSDGTRPFNPKSLETSSFAHLASVANDETITVNTRTLPSLMDDLEGFEPTLIKIDIEGAERELFEEATGYLQDYQGALFVEFSNENLTAVGESTATLEASIRELGFQICLYDPAQNRLSPANLEHPVWYENFVLCHDVDAMNQKLASASKARRRQVTDILLKGTAAKENYLASVDRVKDRARIDDLAKHVAEMNAYLKGGETYEAEPLDSSNKSGDIIGTLQSQFGITKEVAYYNAHELKRRNDGLWQIEDVINSIATQCALLSELLDVQFVWPPVFPKDQKDILEIAKSKIVAVTTHLSLLRQKSELLSEYYASIDSQQQLLTSTIDELKIVVEQVSHGIEFRDAELKKKDQLISDLEASVSEVRRELATSHVTLAEKEAKLVAQQDELQTTREQLEAQRIHREAAENSLRKRNEDLQKLMAEITSLQDTVNSLRQALTERNAYYAHLVSRTMNDLYELKKSRLIRLARLQGSKVPNKINETINRLAE